MLATDNTHRLAGVTATVVTIAAFAKVFVPFYLIGSTPIFTAVCALGAAIVAVNWRPTCAMASRIADILVILAAFYGLVIVSFLIQSRQAVPATHLIGILAFHALFMIFGFSAARSLSIVLAMLLGAAAIYSLAILQYLARFGDLIQEGHLQDIFGVGDPAVFITFHQNIGIVLGLAVLAALGLASNRTRQILVLAILPFVLLLLIYIAARGALVALVCSLIFLAGAGLSRRSRRSALLAIAAVMVTATLASGLAYQRALPDQGLFGVTDAISRTVREIQNPNPGLRLGIWSQTWQRISSEPDRLLFGRGIGMYPVIEGFGAPDWLLRKSEGSKHYPHNVYLEMLYETGVVGLLLFGILTLLPLGIALRRWRLFSPVQKSAISMYVFQLVSSQFSGAFAYGYLDQFFFGLTVGIIALNRADDVLVPDQRVTLGAE